MTRHFGGLNPSRQTDRTKALLLVSVLGVFLIAVLAILFISSGPSPTAAKTVVVEKEADVKMADVLVPIQKINSGTPLEPAMFTKVSRPQVGVSDLVVRDFEEIVGLYARTLIVPNQPLTRDFLTRIPPSSAVTGEIPKGFRAVSIRVDAITGVEGWARPGAHVDVLWISKLRGQPSITKIVQNAKVLSAERQNKASEVEGEQPAAPPSTVTLLVSDQDAQKIHLAQSSGTLSLTLRGEDDSTSSDTVGTLTTDKFFNSTDANGEDHSNEPTVKVKGPNGQIEEYMLIKGKLVPKKAG